MNLSMGMKHYGLEYEEFVPGEGLVTGIYSKVNWSDVLNMNFLDKNLVAYKPFRNFYSEASGWANNDRFYYKFGFASNYTYDNNSGKNYQSFTIPTQFVYAFNNNSSLTVYYEYQNLYNLIVDIIENKNKLEIIRENMKKNYMSDVYNIIETQIKEII